MASFLEGMVGGIAGSMANRLEQADRSDLAVQQAQSIGEINQKLDLQKQQALQELQNKNADTQRTQQVDRINQAKDGIIAKALERKYGAMKPADPSTWTTEQQAVVDKARADEQAALQDDPSIATKAAIQTGDISPKDAMANSSKAEIQQMRSDTAMQVQMARNEAMNAKNQSQYEIAMAKVETAVARAGAGNTDFDKKVKLLKDAGATPNEIANFITEKKQPSLEDLASGFLRSDPNAGMKNALTPSAAYEKAKTLRALTATIREDAAPKPESATAGLPKGAKQIGTSGGKPVYETPDGKRFIQK